MTDNKISYNLSYLKEVSNNDEDFMMDMIKTFIDNAPKSLAEIDHFLVKKEYQQLGKTAHRFAPNLAFIGVDIINKDLDLLEDYAINEKNIDKIPVLVNEIKEHCQLLVETLKIDFNL